MESTGGKSVSKGEEDHAEAFTAGRATRLRASASRELARKPDILIERKREAVPPMPIALTVFERVQ